MKIIVIIIIKLRGEKIFKWEYSNLWKGISTLNSSSQYKIHKITVQGYKGASNKKLRMQLITLTMLQQKKN